MPGAAFCSLGVVVRQAEELGDILDVVRGELLQHLLVPHTLVKCNYKEASEMQGMVL
jgi:hypothetical protein